MKNACTQKKTIIGYSKKVVLCKHQKKPNLPTPSFCSSSPQNCETINCYLSPQSVVLLWQPKRTNSIPLSHSPHRDSPPVPVSAAAAKSLQLCPTLCDPRDVPGILQARTLEWVVISFSNAWKWKVKVKSLSRVWPSATPWIAAFQAPPSMGFSRQEDWSGVPLLSPSSFSRFI